MPDWPIHKAGALEKEGDRRVGGELNSDNEKRKGAMDMCLTCRLLAGELVPPGGVIIRTDKVVLHHCLDVLVPGYLVASPVRHVSTVAGLSDGELAEMAHLLRAAAGLAEAIAGVEKVYVASIGEETVHVHFHLFPRYGWMREKAPPEVYAGGRLDGLRLMAHMRESCRAGKTEMTAREIVEVVDWIRMKLTPGKHAKDQTGAGLED